MITMGVRISSQGILCRFLYGETVDVDDDNMLDVAAAAHYCMVEDLELKVLEFVDHGFYDVALKRLAACHNNGV